MALRAIWQFMDRDVTHRILYGPKRSWCHPHNIIWTHVKLRSIYYFVGDRWVHKLQFGPKCHELFVILYSILAHLSDDMFFAIVYLRPKTISDKIWRKTLYWPGQVNIIHLLHAGEGNMKIYSPKSIIFPEYHISWTHML